jgi:hypothetical protein
MTQLYACKISYVDEIVILYWNLGRVGIKGRTRVSEAPYIHFIELQCILYQVLYVERFY